MSLSMRALVDRKVTNRITYMNNRLAEFAQPVMRNHDLYVYRNFVVSGNEEIRGNSTIDGNLLVKGDEEVEGELVVFQDVSMNSRLFVNGDVSMNSRLFVTSDVSFGARLFVNDLNVRGNINADGYILAKTFLYGQVVNVSMFTNTDIGQRELTVNATATLNVFTFSYTPKYSNSYLIIEYQSVYYLNGSGGDQAYAYMKVNGDRISYSYQKWIGAQGGGTRSSILFPFVGRYTNTNTSAKTIAVDVYNATDTDSITINSDISTWLKITEVGR